MKVRKKPVVVEAWEWDDTREGTRQILTWIAATGTRSAWHHSCSREESVLRIETMEGVMTASPGDFIILGVAGEHYPCKPDIFWETYEKVDEDYGRQL